MATLADAKTISGSSNSGIGRHDNEEWVGVVYDFAVDTGAQADYIALTAAEEFIITDFYAVVETTLAGATANIDLGKGAGGVEFWSDFDGPTLVQTGGANVFMADAAMLPLYVPAAGTIQMGIETADLTAGKMELFFRIRRT